MEKLIEKTTYIINRDRTEALRVIADQSVLFCLAASIAEVAALIPNKPVMRPKNVIQLAIEVAGKIEDDPGHVSPYNAIQVTAEIADRLGLEITQIMGIPAYLNQLNIPNGLTVHSVTGNHKRIEEPAIRIMARPTKKEGGKFSSHAESDINGLSDRRIEEKESRGWQDAVVIGFKIKN